MAEELKRGFGFWASLALATGSIMGTGLFMATPISAQISGNMALLAWIIISCVGIYVAACFGELVALFPKAGGVYEYAKQTYGRFWSFIIGWIAWLIGNITTTLLVVAAISYLTPEGFPVIYTMIISLVFIFLLNVIAYIGVEASSLTMIAFSIITLIVFLVILVPSTFNVNLSNFKPFFDHPFYTVFLTIFFIMETFFGWESVTYLAEETRDPEKNIPKALIIGTILVSVAGLLTYFVLLGNMSWEGLAMSVSPFIDISQMNYGAIGDYIAGIGVYLILIGSAAGGIISSPRLLLALARDKLFLTQFSKIHPKFKTPYRAVILQAAVAVLVIAVGVGDYMKILSILLPLAIVMYVLTLLAVTIHRYKNAHLHRAFKVPFGKIGPVIVSLLFIGLIVMWLKFDPGGIDTLLLALSFVLIGIPIYLLLEMFYDKEAISKVKDKLAYVSLVTEKFSLPLGVRKHILGLLGNIEDLSVLDFGCSVGTLTKHLADAVGANGRVYASDISFTDLEITQKRLKKYEHVRLIHDIQHTTRVHPIIPPVDVIVSVGMLSYIQDIKKVLKELNERLKKGGKFVFLDYSKFFWIIPNVEWLSTDESIKKIFRECGYSARIVREKGFFWEYVYIYGIKYTKKDFTYI